MAKKKGENGGTSPEEMLCIKKVKKVLPAGFGTAVATRSMVFARHQEELSPELLLGDGVCDQHRLEPGGAGSRGWSFGFLNGYRAKDWREGSADLENFFSVGRRDLEQDEGKAMKAR